MTTSDTRAYAKGDKVTPDPSYPGLPSAALGRTFTVVKVNPRNLRCDADDGGQGIDFPAESLLPATRENLAKNRPHPDRVVNTIFFYVGQIVTLTKPALEYDVDTPMVVTRDSGAGNVTVARLGGQHGRYTRVPREMLVKRDVEWLADSLLDSATS